MEEFYQIFHTKTLSILQSRAVEKGVGEGGVGLRAGGCQLPPTIFWSKIIFFHVESENIKFS